MGLALRATFANYSISNLENIILSDNSEFYQFTYSRKVDDNFLIANNIGQIEKLKSTFEENSVLPFTYETEEDKIIFFWTP